MNNNMQTASTSRTRGPCSENHMKSKQHQTTSHKVQEKPYTTQSSLQTAACSAFLHPKGFRV